MPLIGVVIGSKSDTEVIQATLDVLDRLGIEHEVNIISAHRTPEKAREYATSARERGIEVIIASAGMAAHLPGVMASWTTLPIIGVPLSGSDLKGVTRFTLSYKCRPVSRWLAWPSVNPGPPMPLTWPPRFSG